VEKASMVYGNTFQSVWKAFPGCVKTLSSVCGKQGYRFYQILTGLKPVGINGTNRWGNKAQNRKIKINLL